MLGQFDWVQWAVVIAVFVFTTVIAGRLAGAQATIRDYFLGGRTLPWYAISGSIISTEISAVTLVGVPAIIFAPGGDFTYLQLGLFGSTLARILIAIIFVKVYYEREIYSPYDYVRQQLGDSARKMITVLFMLTGLLAQGARLYLTAAVLDLIIGQSMLGRIANATGTDTLTWSIWIMGVVAIVWTLIGGMKLVIWTDVIMFLVLVGSAVFTLIFIVQQIPGGWDEVWRAGSEAGKFRFFHFPANWSDAFAKPYTFWAAIFASTWLSTAILGTDQLMAQRMFCCRSARDARLAIITSSLGQVVTVVVMLTGVALYAFYQRVPASGEVAAAIAADQDNVLPAFVLSEMTRLRLPVAGLVVAGIFAAAISGLDSILAALSQTTLSAFYWNRRTTGQVGRPALVLSPEVSEQDKADVRLARYLVVFWGIVLCGMAQVSVAVSRQEQFKFVLDLALGMAGYAGGALLAGVLLALLRVRGSGAGYLFSAPLSVLTVFALVWHQPWTQWVCALAAAALALAWYHFRINAALRDRSAPSRGSARGTRQTLYLVMAIAIVLASNRYGFWRDPVTGLTVTVSWPWFVPIGSTVAFVFGLLLADRNAPGTAVPSSPRSDS